MPLTEEQIRGYDNLGVHAIKAKLAEPPEYSFLSIPQRTEMTEYAVMKDSEAAEERHRQLLQPALDAVMHARRTANATIGLAVITIFVVLATFWLGYQASKDAEETRKQQSEDAKELLRVQVAMEFDKAFDSVEMRRSRHRLASQLLSHEKVTEDRVADFFENVGMYLSKERIDEDTVYNSYSMEIEGYWPALKSWVEQSRKHDKADSEYVYFEELYKKMMKRDQLTADMTPEEQRDFLIEEKKLAP